MLGDMFLWLVANLKQGGIYFIKQALPPNKSAGSVYLMFHSSIFIMIFIAKQSHMTNKILNWELPLFLYLGARISAWNSHTVIQSAGQGSWSIVEFVKEWAVKSSKILFTFADISHRSWWYRGSPHKTGDSVLFHIVRQARIARNLKIQAFRQFRFNSFLQMFLKSLWSCAPPPIV